MAADYLTAQGYRILARNYRSKAGELDIICTRGGIIVFVEVKTRRGNTFGSPEEAITRTKQDHIRSAALAYLAEHKYSYRELRFDVIGITIQQEKPRINHIIAAF